MKLYLLLFTIFFLFTVSQVVFSQNSSAVDSLNKLIEASQDTTKAKLYLELGDLYEYEDYKKAIEYYNIAYDIANEYEADQSDSISIASAQLIKGKVMLYLGIISLSHSEFDKAEKYFTNANTFFLKLNLRHRLADCFNLLGNLYIYKADYDKAINYYQKSLKYSQQINDKKRISKTINNIGIIYVYIKNYDLAIEYLSESMKYCEELGDDQGIAYSLNNIGNLYYEQKEYEKALDYFNKALVITEKLNDKPGMEKNYINLGIQFKNLKKYDEALNYYQKALAISQEINDSIGIASCFLNMSVIYTSQDNYPKAIEFNKKALSVAQSIGAKNEMKDAYLALAAAYEHIRDFESAYYNYMDYSEVKDSILNQDKARILSETEAKYQTEKKQLEIDMLNKDKELTNKELEKQKTLKYTFVIGLILVLIIVFVLWRSFYLKKKANNILKKQKEEIEHKNKALEFANVEILQQKEEIQAQAEQLEEINKELEKLSIVASETDNAVIIADSFGNIEWVNSGFVKLFGYTLNEFIRKNGRNIIQVSANPEISRLISQCFVTKKSVVYNAQNTTKNDKTIWVQTTLTPILDDKENVIKLVAIDADITKIKDAENEILRKNKEIEKQKIIAEQQRDIISEKNKEITSSIKYAGFIQKAILPPLDVVEANLGDYLLFYKPRNIVSGDFYWLKNIRIKQQDDASDNYILAVADCTGHGVPGAFMSMLGISLLNEVTNKLSEQKIINAAEILNQLREGIICSLHQTGRDDEAKDGMDISLIAISQCADVPISQLDDSNKTNCQISKSNNQLIYHAQWAGANNPLWIIRNNPKSLQGFQTLEGVKPELEELKGDKMPIGIHSKNEYPSFKNNEITLYSGETFYLFSDGFADQFGSNNGVKFKYSRLKKLLVETSGITMDEQKKELEKTIFEWMAPPDVQPFEQIDDITILGIKLK